MRAALPITVLLTLFDTTTDACLPVRPVDPGLPAGSCKTCGMQLIHVNKYMETQASQNMFSDVPAIKDGCAVRTFTCKGKDASIQLWSMAADGGNFGDALTPGTATTTVTCNMAGTAWLNEKEMPITNAVCSFVPACRNCMGSAIAETGFEKPGEEIFDKCVMRKFTCPGVGASIEVSAADGPVKTIKDDGSGMATYTVTCNDNVQWEDQAKVITAVKCVKGPACKSCTKDTGGLIVYGEGDISTSTQNMTSDEIMTTGTCATRKFTCKGKNAQLWWYTNPEIQDSSPTDGTTATLTLTCNADGTAWEHPDHPGFPTFAMECEYSPPCKECKGEWITKDVWVDLKEEENGCSVSKLGCDDSTKKLVVSTAAGVLKTLPGDDLYKVPCNKGGTAWQDGADVITKAECVNACKTCTEASLSTTAGPTSPGMKAMDGNMEDATGACVTRTLTCNGNKAAIEMYNGATYLQKIGAPGGATTVTLTLVCNADGVTWSEPTFPLAVVTGVQCTSMP